MDQIEHLHDLRGALQAAKLDLPTPSAGQADVLRSRVIRRLDDHVVPRLEAADAPLLAVIGGSTGAGKSTVLNSLVGAPVAASSPVRPTTRRPLILHHPGDAHWFDTARILPSLTRVRVAGDASATAPAPDDGGIELRASAALPPGMAVLDAPDLDSVVETNRSLARQLLDAADLWVFVTTAARYADAVPWEVLAQAGERDIAVAVVLNRVPPGAMDAVSSDLRRLMAERGLDQAPLFGIEEQELTDHLLPGHIVEPLRSWLDSLGADALTRAEVAKRTLAGAIGQLLLGTDDVSAELTAQDRAVQAANERLDTQVAQALERLKIATADGTLLRGEVLSRWQDVVGAADFTRKLGEGVSRLRDRLTAALRGRPAPIAPVEDALEAGLALLVREEFHRVREDAEDSWRSDPATSALVNDTPPAHSSEIDERALELTRSWQRDLLAMVRTQGGSRRTSARVMAVGVNVVGVALMMVIFASTGGITGAEVGVAGATAAVAHKLLEAVFGDQEVRNMAVRAREMLLDRVKEGLNESVEPLRVRLPGPSGVDEVRRARSAVAKDWGTR